MASNHSAATSLHESHLQVGQKFNPYKRFVGIVIPEQVCKYRGLSLGAKLVYGRLCRYAGENGDAYPSVPTLGKELGISGKQARRYVRELEAHKFIQSDPKPGDRSHYFFLWHQAFSFGDVGTRRKAAPLPKVGGVPIPKMGVAPLPNVGAKENHHQESQKVSQKKEQAGGWGKGGSGGGTVTIERENPGRRPITKDLSRMADDEKPEPRAFLANPDMEFRTRITERHGTVVDVDLLLRDVRSDLDCVPLAEFLEADLKATTAPDRLRNPHGHYRNLARKIGRRKEAAALEAIAESTRQRQEFLKQRAPAPFKPACTCNDGKQPGGEYCNCKTGSLRRGLDMWAKVGFKPPHQAGSLQNGSPLTPLPHN